MIPSHALPHRGGDGEVPLLESRTSVGAEGAEGPLQGPRHNGLCAGSRRKTAHCEILQWWFRDDCSADDIFVDDVGRKDVAVRNVTNCIFSGERHERAQVVRWKEAEACIEGYSCYARTLARTALATLASACMRAVPSACVS